MGTNYSEHRGSNVTFRVNVTSTSGLTDVFWEGRNTTTYFFTPIDMSDNRLQGGNISVPSLTILDLDLSDGAYYRMKATNQDGTAVSSTIHLNVLPST